jgi:diguanylate cyclase (GGDEF)-like protein
VIAADNTPEIQLALFKSILKTVGVGLIVLDSHERVILWNQWMEQHSFYSSDAVLGKTFLDLFPELKNGRAHNAINGALKNNFASLISQNLNKSPFPLFASADMHLSGDRIQQAVQVMPIDMPADLPTEWELQRHCLVQITDVSMAVSREKQLRELAVELQNQTLADGLTGIPNRRRFDEHMESEFRRAKRSVSPLSLIMIDVDSFKDYNDNYGHQKGDDCLIMIAAALARALGRPCDLVARYGGEEFMAVLPNTNAEGALSLAETMRSEIQLLGIDHAFSKVAPHITISLGVVTQIPAHNTTIPHLIGAADRALYQAKRSGRNCVVVHGEKLKSAPTAKTI